MFKGNSIRSLPWCFHLKAWWVACLSELSDTRQFLHHLLDINNNRSPCVTNLFVMYNNSFTLYLPIYFHRQQCQIHWLSLNHREELNMTDFDASWSITEMNLTDWLLTLIVENNEFQCFNHRDKLNNPNKPKPMHSTDWSWHAYMYCMHECYI